MTCLTCFKNPQSCACPPPANDNFPWDANVLWLPKDNMVATPSAIRRSAMVYRAMGVSRREIPNLLNSRFMEFEGELHAPQGHIIFQHDIDVDRWFNTEADPSCRWLSRFLDFAVMPPVQIAQDRVVPRLLLLWLGVAMNNRLQAAMIIR